VSRLAGVGVAFWVRRLMLGCWDGAPAFGIGMESRAIYDYEIWDWAFVGYRRFILDIPESKVVEH